MLRREVFNRVFRKNKASAGMMPIKKVTLLILAVRDELCLALSLVVRQWGKSAAKGIIFFYSKLCFTVDRCYSAGALSKGVYTVISVISVD